MNRLRSKLTYSNVISTICLFLLVGGGTAVAAGHLGKASVGAKQLKPNSVTKAKLKNGAVTGPKIANGAVGGANLGAGSVAGPALAAGAVSDEKIAPNTITGDKINATTLPTVPNSATTNVVKGSRGTLHVGQDASIFSYGPFTIAAQCQEYAAGFLGERFVITSSAQHSAFSSWEDGSADFGPETPEEDREIGDFQLAESTGPYDYEGSPEVNVSASAANGQAFNAFVGEAAERNTDTCWYWLSANVIG